MDKLKGLVWKFETFLQMFFSQRNISKLTAGLAIYDDIHCNDNLSSCLRPVYSTKVHDFDFPPPYMGWLLIFCLERYLKEQLLFSLDMKCLVIFCLERYMQEDFKMY